MTEAGNETPATPGSGAAYFGKAGLLVEGLRLAERPEVELPAPPG